jgi:MFS transporter, NRE family, putaive nickel resistance protein
MAAFGIGSASVAFMAGSLDKTRSRRISLITGAVLLGIATLGANYVGYHALLGLWLLAGLGQSLAEMPSETLIGENIAESEQGKVYGSHFAFTHLWWAVAYPIAGYFGQHFPGVNFLYGSVVTLLLSVATLLPFRPRSLPLQESGNK